MRNSAFWRRGALLVLAGVFAAGCTGPGIFETKNVAARKGLNKDVAARKGLMKSIGKTWKAVKKAAKADDNKAAGKASGELYKLSGKISKVFKNKGGKSRSKPNVWTDKCKFKQRAEFLAVSAAVFSQVHSKSGSKAMVSKGVKNIGKNCGGCHKTFRAKKKKKM